MATPTIPTTGAGRILGVQTAAETGTTHTFPSLSSLTKSSGDLLIAIVFLFDGNTTNAEFSGWGGGFTEFGDFATATTLSIGAAYKFSTGSETGTFTVTSSGSGRAALILMSIAGAHASQVPEAGGYATGTNAAANPGVLNPAGWDTPEETLWIACAGTGEDATTGSFTAITAAPASYTNLFYQAAADDVVGSINCAVGFRGTTAASEDPGTFTNDTGAIRWGALTIAVRPVPLVPQNTSITPVTIPLTPVAITWSANVSKSISPVTLTLIPVAITVSATDPPDLQVNIVGTTAELTWDASPTSGVSDYSVFRRAPQTGLPFNPTVDTPIASGITALLYDDIGLVIGDYDWQVFGTLPFTPDAITGLVLWLDASDLAKITHSSGAVSQWVSKDSGAKTYVQGTGINQPTTGVTTRNGKNVLDFDITAGWPRFVKRQSGDLDFTSGNFTTFAVVNNAVAGAFGGCAYFVTRTEPFGQGNGYYLTQGALALMQGVNTAATAGTPETIPTGWDYYTTRSNAATPLTIARVNGTQTTPTITTVGHVASTINSEQMVGAYSSANATLALGGSLAEFIIYNSALSDTDILAVEEYLREKWGWNWTPALISTLGWYDSSDTASITSSGGLVSQISDKSGNGHHMTQGTGAQQPTTNSATQNGKNVLVFNQDDDLIAASTGTPVAYAPHTVYAVFEHGTRNASENRLGFLSRPIRVPTTAAGANYEMYDNSGTWTSLGVATPGDNVPHILRVRATNALQAFARVNRGSEGGAVTCQASTLAYWGLITNNTVASQLYEYIVLPTSEPSGSDTDILIMDYLTNKWGIGKFSPSDITDLAVWHDASNAASITASSGAVSQWNDLSDNGRHLTQATGSLQPITGTRTQNGLNVIDFDGVDDYMTTPSFTYGDPSTIFVVALNDDGADSVTAAIVSGSSTLNHMYLFKAGTSNKWRLNNGGALLIDNGTADTNAHVHTAITNGASSSLYTDASSTSGTQLASTVYTEGRRLGARDTGGAPWDGWIAEHLHYNRALSGTEIAAVQNYLKTKWGTP